MVLISKRCSWNQEKRTGYYCEDEGEPEEEEGGVGGGGAVPGGEGGAVGGGAVFFGGEGWHFWWLRRGEDGGFLGVEGWGRCGGAEERD